MGSWMSARPSRLRSLVRVIRRDPALAALTCLSWGLLVITRGIVLVLPLRRISARLGEHLRETVPEDVPVERHRAIRRIRRSIDKAAPHTPTISNCYPRALTATFLLRLARLPSTMYYGARVRGNESELETHVWVRSGPFFVTGSPQHRAFATVATYAHVPRGSAMRLVPATLTTCASAGTAREATTSVDSDTTDDAVPAGG